MPPPVSQHETWITTSSQPIPGDESIGRMPHPLFPYPPTQLGAYTSLPNAVGKSIPSTKPPSQFKCNSKDAGGPTQPGIVGVPVCKHTVAVLFTNVPGFRLLSKSTDNSAQQLSAPAGTVHTAVLIIAWTTFPLESSPLIAPSTNSKSEPPHSVQPSHGIQTDGQSSPALKTTEVTSSGPCRS